MVKLLFFSFFCVVILSGINAQKRIYNTLKISSDVRKVDGIFDESVWLNVEWSGGFIQREPYDKQPATEDQIKYNTDDEVYETDENLNGTIDYTFDNPSFNVFDFNSKLVIR